MRVPAALAGQIAELHRRTEVVDSAHNEPCCVHAPVKAVLVTFLCGGFCFEDALWMHLLLVRFALSSGQVRSRYKKSGEFSILSR
jgi:hypothetical protein